MAYHEGSLLPSPGAMAKDRDIPIPTITLMCEVKEGRDQHSSTTDATPHVSDAKSADRPGRVLRSGFASRLNAAVRAGSASGGPPRRSRPQGPTSHGPGTRSRDRAQEKSSSS
jgi:hypothetical protein